jgi:hypothetical protein
MTRYEEEISSNLERADTNLQQGRDLNSVNHSFDSKHPCQHVIASASCEAIPYFEEIASSQQPLLATTY